MVPGIRRLGAPLVVVALVGACGGESTTPAATGGSGGNTGAAGGSFAGSSAGAAGGSAGIGALPEGPGGKPAGTAGMGGGNVCHPPAFEDAGVRAALEPSIVTYTVGSVPSAMLHDVSSLAGLECLTGLNSLVVDGGTLTDLAPLQELTVLETLELYDVPVTDLEPIGDLRRLLVLGLSGTAVSDVAPLATFDRLELLDLTNTKVADVGPLRGCFNLKILNASGAPLEDIQGIVDLPFLERVDVSRTRLTSIPRLGPPPEASSCPKVQALETDLDTETLTRTIPMLCDLGWAVQWSIPGGPEDSCGPSCEPQP